MRGRAAAGARRLERLAAGAKGGEVCGGERELSGARHWRRDAHTRRRTFLALAKVARVLGQAQLKRSVRRAAGVKLRARRAPAVSAAQCGDKVRAEQRTSASPLGALAGCAAGWCMHRTRHSYGVADGRAAQW